jgi:hypothetical protein
MLARTLGFSAAELRTIEGIVRQNIQILRDAWDAYFAP